MAEEADKVTNEQPPEATPEPVEPAGQPAATEGAEADQKTTEQAAEAAEEEKGRAATPVPPGQHYFWGTGRRKTAVARVRLRPGTGKILINKRDMEEYFHAEKDRGAVLAPLRTTRTVKTWDIWANVNGGGVTGQAGAVKLGLAWALAKAMPDAEHGLRDEKLLTRDPRMSERKKPGQKGARKRFQFSKR